MQIFSTVSAMIMKNGDDSLDDVGVGSKKNMSSSNNETIMK